MPRTPEPSWDNGIRSIRADEFDSLRALLDSVFWPGLVERYPHVYVPANAKNLRVMAVDGQIVSHVGTLRRYASILGCTVRVASLGGVATYEQHRGKGYATALLQDTVRDCRVDGVDFVVVSGYRKMYYRQRCRYVGRDLAYTITADRAGDFDDGGLEVAQATKRDVPAIATIYRNEPVRWLRPPSDFANALVGYVMNRPAHVLTVNEGGPLRGYAIVQQPREQDEGRAQVLEFAGDRRCLVGILGRLVREHGLRELGFHVMGVDRLLQDLLRERGLSGTPANVSGTVGIVNFVQFMDRMRPYFAEVLGESEAEGLVFQERGEELTFLCGDDRVVAGDRGEAVQLIFGTLDAAEEPLLGAGGRAGEVLRKIFPIPALWTGMNYV